MKIPIVPGDGRPPFEIDSDDFPRFVLLTDGNGELVWWDRYADEVSAEERSYSQAQP